MTTTVLRFVRVALLGALLAPCAAAAQDNRCVEFQVAALNNDVPKVATFINGGVDVNCRDSATNETALMQAARNGSIEALKLLMVAGADMAARAPSGETALAIATGTESALAKGGPNFAPLRSRLQQAITELQRAGARD
jgi:hypothetical protein